MNLQTNITQTECYHCGEHCPENAPKLDDKKFCCQGCLTVYELLGSHDLCSYYDLENAPGRTQNIPNGSKYDALDHPDIVEKFTHFEDENTRHVSFQIPYMHCSSCIYLLQNLNRLSEPIQFSNVNFNKKTVSIAYAKEKLELSELARLLASVGYEPQINIADHEDKKKSKNHRSIEIGVAGFCFGNIMLFSFPEYLGLEITAQSSWLQVFRLLSLVLALPVVLFSAKEFWSAAWAGLRHRSLNVNVPVTLALVIIFGKSCYDILSGTGAGYLDSLAGLVFFMLLGRYAQDKTIGKLNHDIDFKSFFPSAFRIERNGKSLLETIERIKPGDEIQLGENEVIPMDSLLLDDSMKVDYSFLTGESMAQYIGREQKLYAGGRNKSRAKRIMVSRPFDQSQFVSLWQNPIFKNKKTETKDKFLDSVAMYFTIGVLILSFAAFGYWAYHGAMTKAWSAVTTALIVACPCALLLSSTFARGFISQELGKKDVHLKSLDVLLKLPKIKTIVFDKTGTLTDTDESMVEYQGEAMNSDEKQAILSILQEATHPIANVLSGIMDTENLDSLKVDSIKEEEQGLEGWVADRHVKIGTPQYMSIMPRMETGIEIVMQIDGHTLGSFLLRNVYKTGIKLLFEILKDYSLCVLSGDRK